MGLFMERCILTLVNMFLPPLSVMLVAGVGMDALVNTFWFLCGVIPGHVHGFYVTWTYFSRKRKVRRGRWPGGPKSFIYSRRVVNGDASDEAVRRLWMEEQERQREKVAGSRPTGSGVMPSSSSSSRRRRSGRRRRASTRESEAVALGEYRGSAW